MIITCEACSTSFQLDESVLKPDGSKVRCSRCRHIFVAYPPAPESPLELEAVEAGEPDEAEIEFDAPTEPEIEFDAPTEPEQEAESFEFDEPFEEEDAPGSVETDEDTESLEVDSLEMESLEMESLEVDPADTDFEMADPEMEISTTEPGEADIEISFDEADSNLDLADDLAFEETGPEAETSEEPEFDAWEEEQEIEFEPADIGVSEDASEDEFDSLEFEQLDLDSGETFFEAADEETAEDGLDLEPADEVDIEEDAFPDLEMEETEAEPDLTSGLELDAFPDAEDPAFQENGDEESPEAPLTMEEAPLEFDLADDVTDDLSLEGEGQDPEDFQDDLPQVEPEEMPLTADGEFEDLGGLEDDIPLTDLSDDKFSSYDQVLEQDTEPEVNFSEDDTFPDDDGFPEEFPEDDEPAEAPEAQDSVPEASPEEAAAVAAESPAREPALSPLIQPADMADDTTVPRKKRKAKSTLSAPVMVLLLLFILVGGAYVANMYMGIRIPYLSDLKLPNIPFIEKYLPQKEAEKVPEPAPVPDQKSVNGRFVSNETAGELFVITGKIENPAAIPYNHIRVEGTLFQKGKIKAMSQTAFCGNIISEEVLKTGNITDIMAQLNIAQGNANTNVNIRPGTFVPFMLVFSNLPENLQNFTVEVKDFSPPRLKNNN